MVDFEILKDESLLVSNDAKETAINKYGVDATKTVVVYNGIVSENFQNFQNIKKDLGYREDDKIVLCIGRVTKAKGVEDFCKVAEKLYRYNNIKFVFVGGYNDKNYFNKIYNKYNKYINFLGLRLDIANLYYSSDIFLFLSHRESFGYTLVESMNYGLPIVGWNVVGVRELVKHNYNGIICDFGDIECAKDAVLKLISNDDLYKRFRQNALVESQKYTIEKNTDEILKIFKSLEK